MSHTVDSNKKATDLVQVLTGPAALLFATALYFVSNSLEIYYESEAFKLFVFWASVLLTVVSGASIFMLGGLKRILPIVTTLFCASITLLEYLSYSFFVNPVPW